MQPLRYYINVTLDGCSDHRAIAPDEELFRNGVKNFDQADALLFGRVTYEMMEEAWRPPAPGVSIHEQTRVKEPGLEGGRRRHGEERRTEKREERV